MFFVVDDAELMADDPLVWSDADPVPDDSTIPSLAQPPTITPNKAMAPMTLTDRSAMVFPFS